MACHYVYHAGDNTGTTSASFDNTKWTTAWQSLNDADASVSAGDTIYVAHDHYKNYIANISITLPSCTILVVDRTTGAKTVHTSSYGDGNFSGAAATNTINLTQNSTVYIEGLRFGTTWYTVLTGPNVKFVLRRCTHFSAAGVNIIVGSLIDTAVVARFEDCTFNNNSTTGQILRNHISSTIEVINPTFQNIHATTSLFNNATSYNGYGKYFISCADLSVFSTLMTTEATNSATVDVELEDCKIPASWVEISNSQPTAKVTMRRCSSSSISTPNTRDFYLECNDHICQFDNANSRSGADGASGNTYSIKLSPSASATYANCARLNQRLSVWHDGSGSKTLTVHMGSGDSGLYDDDVYAIVTQPSEEATAYQNGKHISTFPTSARAAAGTSTYLDNDNETSEWVEGSSVTTTYQFKVAGINPTVPGYVYVDIFVTKPSINVWVDPAITLT